MNKIVDFKEFKNQKEFDADLPKFSAYCNRFFGEKISPELIFKILYYSIRYAEANIGVLRIYSKFGLCPELDDKGKQILISWFKSLIKYIEEG